MAYFCCFLWLFCGAIFWILVYFFWCNFKRMASIDCNLWTECTGDWILVVCASIEDDF